MPRVSNRKAAECIRNLEPFDNNSGALGGARSFKGWGKTPSTIADRQRRLPIRYWVYSGDTPIAWYDIEWYMPAVWHDEATADHQTLVAKAVGLKDPWADRNDLITVEELLAELGIEAQPWQLTHINQFINQKASRA